MNLRFYLLIFLHFFKILKFRKSIILTFKYVNVYVFLSLILRILKEISQY